MVSRIWGDGDQREDWRGAAAVVAHDYHDGELIAVVIGDYEESAFGYYARRWPQLQHAPRWPDLAWDDVPAGPRAPAIPASLAAVAARDGLWLVIRGGDRSAPIGNRRWQPAALEKLHQDLLEAPVRSRRWTLPGGNAIVVIEYRPAAS
jgi:hypothetical protein